MSPDIPIFFPLRFSPVTSYGLIVFPLISIDSPDCSWCHALPSGIPNDLAFSGKNFPGLSFS